MVSLVLGQRKAFVTLIPEAKVKGISLILNVPVETSDILIFEANKVEKEEKKLKNFQDLVEKVLQIEIPVHNIVPFHSLEVIAKQRHFMGTNCKQALPTYFGTNLGKKKYLSFQNRFY
jgi:hypothetical protein